MSEVWDFNEAEVPLEFQRQFEGIFRSTEGMCEHCGAYRWKRERKGLCCLNGTVKLPQLPPPPDELLPLYTASGSHFLKHARAYNNLFALASLGCSEIRQPGFNPTFTVQGKMYHRIGSLLPAEGESAKFAQLYFHDTENAVSNRMNVVSGLQEHNIQLIDRVLREVNPYITSLKAGIELMEASPEVRLVLHADKNRRPTGEHARRYNLPTASEVGAILPGEVTANLDVILHPREGPLRRISPVHRSYDPLHYVMLFPYGNDGFQLGLRKTNNRTLTALDYYSYRLQSREGEWNTIMKSRRLMQQYAVDQFAKIEGSRLDWVRNNQRAIRAEKYSGLIDANGQNDLQNAGRRIILPPTVYGSPRFYHEKFQDAMAIVRKFGKPDLFLTFTCNPQWQEIQEALNEGESYTDRPDLCVRVFKMKMDELLSDLTCLHVMGKVKAYTATVEFQKRGLPHVHIVLILEDGYKPLTPEIVDTIVSAEIPDKDINPKLHKIITRNNIHGPCGHVRNSSPCMVGEGADRKCSKKFPKPLIQSTALPQQNYPEYRRRGPNDGGNTHVINLGSASDPNLFEVDNSWVVPYNPMLSLKFDAHINVEVVYSTKCVKYLYKYLTKGQDRVIIELNPQDEVEQYQNARYISASEAFWRIYQFDLHHRSPAVEKLDCHLPGEQTVIFEDGREEEALAVEKKTKLMAYFEINRTDDFARTILYPDFPQHFTWNAGGKKWTRRRRGGNIGRIPMISLNSHQSELFYLRLLLHNKAGATSFEDLKTFDGRVCESFQEACIAAGLLERDDELDRVVEEAATIRSGDQLRDVFINILLYSRPSDTRLVSFY